MESITRKYDVLIYPCSGTVHTPSSEIHMEVAGDFKAFYEDAMEWIGAFHQFRYDYSKGCRNDDIFRIHDGVEEDFGTRCNEEEIILSLLYCCKNREVRVKEICYQGNCYTDISDITFSEGFVDDMYIDSPERSDIRLHAKKNGCDMLIYLFGACCIHGEKDIGGYPLSHGMVEVKENRMHYAGTYCYDAYYEETLGCGRDYTRGVEVFLETDGENIAFSVLMGGELYKKISRDDEKIVFHSALRNGTLLRETSIDKDYEGGTYRPGFWECLDAQDVVFRKDSDGLYRYMGDNREVAGIWSGKAFVPPQTPDPDSLDEKSVHRLCECYINTFYTVHPAEDPGTDADSRGAGTGAGTQKPQTAADSEDPGTGAGKDSDKAAKKDIGAVLSMRKRLGGELRARVKGQDMAVEKFVDGYVRYQLRGRVPGKPAGIYLFAGPPGNGKTYLAETFAKLKDVENAGYQYKRFDMAAYGGGNS